MFKFLKVFGSPREGIQKLQFKDVQYPPGFVFSIKPVIGEDGMVGPLK